MGCGSTNISVRPASVPGARPDREIMAGHVRIGERTAQMGDQVLPGERVWFCGKLVEMEEEEILIAFHKPRGIVCTAEKREKNNIIDYINYPKRIYPRDAWIRIRKG